MYEICFYLLGCCKDLDFLFNFQLCISNVTLWTAAVTLERLSMIACQIQTISDLAVISVFIKTLTHLVPFWKSTLLSHIYI